MAERKIKEPGIFSGEETIIIEDATIHEIEEKYNELMDKRTFNPEKSKIILPEKKYYELCNEWWSRHPLYKKLFGELTHFLGMEIVVSKKAKEIEIIPGW